VSEIHHKSADVSSTPKAEVIVMSAAIEARQLIVSIAGPLDIGGKIKEALYRVARVTGLPERRVRGIWNLEARAIRAEEMDALRRAASGKAKINELEALAARLAAVETRLAAVDPNFALEDRTALRRATDRVRRLDRGGLSE